MQYRRTAEILDEGRLLHQKALECQFTDPRQFDELMARAEYIYNQYLNKNPGDPNVVHLLGSQFMLRGWNGLATMMFNAVVQSVPTFGPAWNHLGICLQREHRHEAANVAFEQAEIHLKGDEHWADIPANRAGSYINVGEPEVALGHAERALAHDPNNPHARWHKALALLELQRWTPGWEFWEARKQTGANTSFKPRNYHGDAQTPEWDGKSGKLVVIHGEQGLGDEIMFASCIPDAVRANPGIRFVLECNPRLADLFRVSFPTVEVFGTHKRDGREWLKPGELPDYKVALGSLPGFYRPDNASFPGAPFVVTEEVRAREWREKLRDLPRRPNIGIAWQGGAQTTRVDLRSVQLGSLYPVLSQPANFISLQYTTLAQQECDEFFATTGIRVHHWEKAAHGDNMADQAALISQLDAVVTVCQTCVHVAGALGTPAMVLVPSGPSWRYGVTGNMPWYQSVDLFRQAKSGDWTATVAQVAGRLRSLITQREAA
jgi:tetratricopeptide (TPR) repeat protein